ncbi:MAG: hypothetical protein ACI8UO_001464 [Verrucomicrobiales bacterium]|jgi:hypothetical protein
MKFEPEDNSTRPHPLPIRISRWLLRLTAPLIVIGFIWTVVSTVRLRSTALEVAAEQEESEKAFNQNPEISALKTELAAVAEKEADLWLQGRELAMKSGEFDEETWRRIEELQIATLKGRLVQAQLREEYLRAEFERLTKQLGELD